MFAHGNVYAKRLGQFSHPILSFSDQSGAHPITLPCAHHLGDYQLHLAIRLFLKLHIVNEKIAVEGTICIGQEV
jgi:hypothetical protein